MRFATTIVTLVLLVMFGAGSVTAGFVPDYESYTLKNGLRVIVAESHQEPMVVFRLMFMTGSGVDADGRHGLAAITTELIKMGTERYSGEMLAAVIDSVGGMINTDARRDMLVMEGDFLSRDLDLGFSCLADMVVSPTLDPDDLGALKRRFISYKLQLDAVTSDRLLTSLYGKIYGEESYGVTPTGTRSGLRRITIEDVRAYHATYMRPNNAVLVVGGDIDIGSVKKQITRYFSTWKRGEEIVQPHITASSADSLRIFLIDRPNVPTTEFVMGLAAVPPDDEKFAPLILLNYILGGGGEVSRLYDDLIRGDELVSAIRSQVDFSRHGGVFYVIGSAPTEMAADALARIFDIQQELREIRVPMRELNDAKRFYQGYLPRYYETSSSAVRRFGFLCGLNVAPNFYESLSKRISEVDPQTLRKVASEYLDPNHMYIIVAGPESRLKGSLMGLGSVEIERRGSE